MDSFSQDFYPRPSKESLCNLLVGKHLSDVPTPAAILDRAVVERNCRQMLNCCKSLGVRLRAHVKTHKVTLPSFTILVLYSIESILYTICLLDESSTG